MKIKHFCFSFFSSQKSGIVPEKPKKQKPPKGVFQFWPKIGMFHHVRANYSKEKKEISYKAKIKLHGTNSAVTVQKGKAMAQSRNNFVYTEKANFAFYSKFVQKNSRFFESLWPSGAKESLTFFGEWCGEGIMKGASICEIKKNAFCLFACQIDDRLVTEPEEIKKILQKSSEKVPDNLFVIPWHNEEAVVLRMDDEEQLSPLIDKITHIVEDIDKEDPFVKQLFGVSGTGEGQIIFFLSKFVQIFFF